MPFISVKTNKPLDSAQIEDIKSELGSMIALFPGKSEAWLMCEVEGDCALFFKGSAEPCAFAEVKLYGSVDKAASERFTASLCVELGTYGIPADRVYVRYEGGTDWGWNGSNF